MVYWSMRVQFCIQFYTMAWGWDQNVAPFVGDVGGDGRDGGQRDGVGFQGAGETHGLPVHVLHVQDGWFIWASDSEERYSYTLFLDHW